MFPPVTKASVNVHMPVELVRAVFKEPPDDQDPVAACEATESVLWFLILKPNILFKSAIG